MFQMRPIPLSEIATFTRYAMTGLANTAVDASFFSVLVLTGVPPSAANLLGFLAGAINSFAMNRHFTFRDHNSSSLMETLNTLAAFASVTAFCSGITYISFEAVRPYFGIASAKCCAIALTVVCGYLLNRFFVFRRRVSPEEKVQ
nr:GtrA family protein [Rhizobium sp. L1K21]